jgi:hypothetical protein
MGVVGRLDQYASMLCNEFDEITAKNTSITGLGTYYSSEFNENIIDIVRDGLVLNLDAGNLSSYSGSGTTWTDVSGLGNNGTLTNGPTYSSANGGSIVFDGTNDYVTINQTLSTPFTITGFVRYTDQAKTLNTFINTNPHTVLAISLNRTGTGDIYVYIGNGSSWLATPAIISSTNMIVNQWYQVSFTTTGSGSTLYLNGNSVGTSIYSPSGWGSTYYLGTIIIASGEYLRGNIANTQIYNRALTASEIQQNYNALATRYGLTTTGTTAPMSANVFPPYDLVYDEFGGTFFGAGQGRYMRQNTDKSVIVYNEIDEITDFRDIVRTGLVLDLDAGMNASYAGIGTVWDDLSGNGNNGTLINMNATNYSSTNSGRFSFDGIDERIDCGNSSSLQITVGTISAWFNATNANSGYNGIIAKQNAWGLFVKDNILLAYDWGNNLDRSTGITVGNSTWNYAVMTFTETVGTPSNNAIIYLNGSAVLTTTIRHSNHNVQVQIGEANASQLFTGNIASAFVYNRALAASEVSQNYNALKHRFGL